MEFGIFLNFSAFFFDDLLAAPQINNSKFKGSTLVKFTV
jgi:hypothetical protein